MKQYMCLLCGLIYKEAEGWPDDGIAPGTLWADVRRIGVAQSAVPVKMTLRWLNSKLKLAA